MYFRTGSNVANLSLYEDCRIDCFEGFNCFSGLTRVLLEGLGRNVEDDGVKPSLLLLPSPGSACDLR